MTTTINANHKDRLVFFVEVAISVQTTTTTQSVGLSLIQQVGPPAETLCSKYLMLCTITMLKQC